MTTINQNINITQIKQMQFNYVDENNKKRHFLLMPGEALEILRMMNELNYSIEDCFERFTGRLKENVSHVYLQLGIK